MTAQQSDMQFPHENPVSEAEPETKRQRRRRLTAVTVKDIQVTDADIMGAIKENSHSCMIAEAIKRQVPGVKNVVVDVQSIRWTDVKRRVRVIFLTPRECQANLVRFDRGVPPLPFSFGMRSSQVTPVTITRMKVDAEGQIVRVKVKTTKRLKDGTVREYTSNRAAQVHVKPSVKSELIGADRPGTTFQMGGRPPPVSKNALHRGFGVRAFTWDAGEEEAAIVARHAAYLGITPPNPTPKGR